MKNKVAQLSAVHVRLWTRDLEYIRRRHPDNYNAQIRRIVRNWVSRHKPETKDDEA